MNRSHLLSQRRKARKSFSFPKKEATKILKKVFIVVIILVPILLIPRLIPIASIECENQKGNCTPELKEKLQHTSTRNLASSQAFVHKTLSNQVSVKKYAIRFLLPSKLVVHVIERQPVVAIAKEGATSDFAFVDDEGVIVGLWAETELPILVVDKNSEYKAGQKLTPATLFAAQVTQQSYKKYGSRLAFLKPDMIEIDLPSGIKAQFPTDGDLDLLFGSLSIILSRLNSDTIKVLPTVIDLRYKNPILK